MTAPQPHDETSYRRGERRWLMLALLLGFPLFLIIVLCLPNIGPVLRVYAIPSSSMAPALPLGSYAVVSRAAYGYSRYSFDDFELPITGRLPMRMPERGDIVVFRLPRDHGTQFRQARRGPARRPHPGGRRAPVDQRRARAPRAGGQDPQSLRRPRRGRNLARDPARRPLLPHRALRGRAWPLREHRPSISCPRATSSCSATTVPTPPTAACSRRASASASCPSTWWWDGCSSPSEGSVADTACLVLFSGGQRIDRLPRLGAGALPARRDDRLRLRPAPRRGARPAPPDPRRDRPPVPRLGRAPRRRPHAGACHARRHQRDRPHPRRRSSP